MNVTVKVPPNNTKTILDLLEIQGVSLPCNCHGTNACGGKQYSFPCDLIPLEDITVSVPERKKFSGLTLSGACDKSIPPDTLLIDLGTTTVAMVYYNSISNTVFLSDVFPNPQISFGADVISRIKFDAESENKGILKSAIQEAITEHYNKATSSNSDISIKKCLIGGNTTMIHFLMGYSIEGLKSAPFQPAKVPSKSVFTNENKGVQIQVIPWLSSFIGGDILSGILSLDFDSRHDTCLLADLGTNGELVLLHNRKLYTASTAAGPAFEGGGLTCGCPSIPGAISDVALHSVKPSLKTIDNKLPAGICGSGAISMVAEVIKRNYMDASGILTEKFPPEGIVLAKQVNGPDISFTRDDLRQMQLAIASISGGIDALCHFAGIKTNQIDQLYLAGGLGVHINLDKAIHAGLFCDVAPQNIHPVGNSCLNGLAKISSSHNSLDDLISEIKSNTSLLELADDDYFKQSFTKHLTYE